MIRKGRLIQVCTAPPRAPIARTAAKREQDTAWQSRLRRAVAAKQEKEIPQKNAATAKWPGAGGGAGTKGRGWIGGFLAGWHEVNDKGEHEGTASQNADKTEKAHR